MDQFLENRDISYSFSTNVQPSRLVQGIGFNEQKQKYKDENRHYCGNYQYPIKKKKIRSQSEEREKDESSSVVDQEENQYKEVTVGICCMEKKSKSKEMQEILSRFNPEVFKIDIFDEKMILEDPIEGWPIVECLFCFYSDGFPLGKAISYAELRKPFLINDIRKQQFLWDRMHVYTLMKDNNIPLPKHHFVLRDTDHDIISNYINQEKESLRKLLKKQQISAIIEEEDNVDNVINFLKQDQEESKSDEKEVKIKESTSGANLVHLEQYPIIKLNSEGQTGSFQSNNETEKEDSNTPKRMIREHSNKQRSSMRSYDPTSLAQMIDLKRKGINFQKELIQKTDLVEFDDYILVDGQKLVKPFVEKPFDAENHNINIYYNSNEGGGCKNLFRKVGNQSSSFDPSQNSIRLDCSNYIYEEFLPTNGFDIKVYTVGEFYAHAEARKSPVLDGKVQRTETGKEVRYPVCLTPEEKLMATKIVNVFGQNVCGFDLLRCNGKSYVCDVNGWSFVKGNIKYYQDCAAVLSNMILKKLRPALMQKQSAETMYMKNISKNSFRPSEADLESVDTVRGINQELRSVVAVFRHGDRTPKQKMKMKTTEEYFLQFFEDQKDPSKEVKLKHPKQLVKLLEATRECIQSLSGQSYSFSEDNILMKLLQMRSVLEKGGHFDGINRKVQLRPLKMRQVEKDGVSKTLPSEVLLILKWGGELTFLGENQAVDLGSQFRNNMYPQDKEGLLRLHSTYRHDLKTFSSDEGRCQNTAAAFLKGFLGYEGEVTPILASMVIKNQTAQKLLDCNTDELLVDTDSNCCSIIGSSKCLSEMLQSEESIESQFQRLYPDVKLTIYQKRVIEKLVNPRQMLNDLHDMVGKLTRNIRYEVVKSICRHHLNLQYKDYYIRPEDMQTDEIKNPPTTSDETLILFFKRWYKLHYDFCQTKGLDRKFNISKIPDIYDSIKYLKRVILFARFDIVHNFEKIKSFYEGPEDIFLLAQKLAAFMVPFESGISESQKLAYAKTVASPLCMKIREDLLWWRFAKNSPDEDYWKYRQNYDFSDINSPWRHVRTRLYFTSASHMYSLYNILYYGLGHYLIEDEEKKKELKKIITLQYLSHIVIKLYEDLNSKPDDPERFRLELSVSDGCQLMQKTHDYKISDNIHINTSLKLDALEEFLNQIIQLDLEQPQQQQQKE